MIRQMTWLQIWAWACTDVQESDFENSLLFSSGNNQKKDKSFDYMKEARMDDSRQKEARMDDLNNRQVYKQTSLVKHAR